MENKTRKNRRTLQRKARARKILLTASLLLVVIAASVGGTIAWLTATTDSIVNTFTYGDINITLAETTGNNYKIIPGVNIPKDPTVTVTAGSEACYLFVKVEEENWPTFTETDGTKKVGYAIADGWKPLEGETGVYYREVGVMTADTPYAVLAGNVVTVSENLTKTEVNSVTEQPKLTFTAYAVQKDGINNVANAWAKVSTTNP